MTVNMHEVRRAMEYGARQSTLEAESAALSDAIRLTERVIDELGPLRGEYKEDLLGFAHELKTELLVARCFVEEQLATLEKRDLAAQNAEYQHSIGY